MRQIKTIGFGISLLVVLALVPNCLLAEDAVLRLPFFASQKHFPLARIPVDKGVVPGHVDPLLYIWDSIPWEEGYDEFLRRWGKAEGPRDFLALAKWCEQKKWPILAEYAYRRILRKDLYGKLRDPTYKKAVKAWRPLAAERIPEFVAEFPLRGEWKVLVDKTGHHYIKDGAAFAVDLVVERNGRAYRGSGRKLTDHYAWDQPVMAGVKGKVVFVQGDKEDLPIGKIGGFTEANAVIIDAGEGIRVLYAHLKKGSVTVKKGDHVTPNTVIGTIGNSGASGLPHLHLTFLDYEHASIPHRFSFEMKVRGRWVQVEEGDLPEGYEVRPLRD